MHYLVGFFVLAALIFSPAPTSAEENNFTPQEETPKVEVKEAAVDTNAEQAPVEETNVNVNTETETEAADDYYYADYDYDYDYDYEDYDYDYSGGGSYYANDFQSAGVVYSDGWRWTWYSQNVLPGGGLDIPGRHVDDSGYVCDENGYICLASGSLDYGSVVETPFGKQGRVYDSGCAEDTLDVYTNF